jgi:hypothetical protein
LSKIAENCDHNIDPWFRSGFSSSGTEFFNTLAPKLFHNFASMALPVSVACERRRVDVGAVEVGRQVGRQAVVEVPVGQAAGESDRGAQLQKVGRVRLDQDSSESDATSSS